MMPNFWILLLVILVVALLLKEYLPGYAREKGKNLATREDIADITRKVEAVKADYTRDLERVRAESEAANRRIQAELDRTTFVHRVQFETEFATLSDLWIKLAAVRARMDALRPRVTIVDLRENPHEALQARFVAFSDTVNSFIRAVHDRSPFYPENIFAELVQIIDCVNRERTDIALVGGPQDNDWFTRGEVNLNELLTRVETVARLIRERIAELSVIDRQ
jgi:hypothetical protein